MRVAQPIQARTEAIPVILNAASGPGHSPEEAERLQRAFRDAGLKVSVRVARSGDDILELTRRAMQDRPALLVAGGGDGTMNAVANVLRGTGTALGILPLGTLNHFAKDLGVPLQLDQAARTIASGRRIAVDVGEVNGKTFINNSSLGIYPDIVRERTRQQRRFGRRKRAAMIWATLAALNRLPLLTMRLQLEDREFDCRAPFVFIGNNEYLMEGFNIGKRARLDAGVLSVYTTQHSTRAGLLELALRAILGRLRQADDFIALRAGNLRVETPHKRLLVATDGEVSIMETPLEYHIRPRSLNVVVP
jgi:YegS/Rv2252/BmrU family lipid kinase